MLLICNQLCLIIITSRVLLVYGTESLNGVAEQDNLLKRLQNSLPKYAPPNDMRNRTAHIFLGKFPET